MSKSRLKQAEEIMATLDCPTDFACYKSGFELFIKVQNFTLDELLTCKGNCCYTDPATCKKSIKGLNKQICSCPMRVYMANYLVNLASLVPSDDHVRNTCGQLAKASSESKEDNGK